MLTDVLVCGPQIKSLNAVIAECILHRIFFFMNDRRTTVIYTHPEFSEHLTPPGHPECYQRYQAIYEHLHSSAIADKVVWKRAEEANLNFIEFNHSRAYVRFVEEACLNLEVSTIDGGDTYVCHESFRVARLGVGAAIALVDDVLSGECKNGFVALRPPGHHACEEKAMGFCLFNNVAIAARYAQACYGLERVLILDWDVHHGNGTQDSFYNDASVFFISLHQYPFYPGTGSADEIGIGPGKGTTLNIPMSAGAAGKDYRAAFAQLIEPAIRAFAPHLILLSAGFDAHRQDDMAGIELDDIDFGWMTEQVLAIADEVCGGRVVSLLEGGYHLEALARSVKLHVECLCGA